MPLAFDEEVVMHRESLSYRWDAFQDDIDLLEVQIAAAGPHGPVRDQLIRELADVQEAQAVIGEAIAGATIPAMQVEITGA